MNYTFDDEIANKFSYDSKNKEIKVYFDNYYKNKVEFNSPCVLIIKKWNKAFSKLFGDEKFEPLEVYLGVFSIILNMEIRGDELKMSINTMDDRYLELLFVTPKISIKLDETHFSLN
ncbi:hypothetical protein Q4Q34_05675 [Flavivirga abyssicola]|uniref:hypothetical protein n=1 Tax=Flavivirga abyssicola TaxID=3063533 RepID=UPI0026DF336F|nr:hypothetical protein [Flavivirga sp. MEBiC07777]WVK14517.1 hypothetical protein Q4Q34_05675 [Flavivirga sp. MEBiC07777]